MKSKRDIHIAIDRGGTFTDVFATRSAADGDPDQQVVFKLLSVDPQNYNDANVEGIRRVLEAFTGQEHPRGTPLCTDRLASIRLGTTVATNALLERNGERCALLITKGFRDLLYIGNQARPDIFSLKVVAPHVLYEKVVEVDERVTLLDYAQGHAATALDVPKQDIAYGQTGERIHIIKKLDLLQIRKDLENLHSQGFKSIAICTLHSYTFPDHERAIAQVAQQVGFPHVTVSADIMPRIKAVSRGMTATTDAYLTPKIKLYVDKFVQGFTSLEGVKVEFMRSDGGLTPVDDFRGYAAILSGPAGGVVGYAKTSFSEKLKIPVIGFDMGGTSTDVSRYDGQFEHVFETTTAGVTITSPQLNINTVAAGGSSKLFYRNGMFVVGPESAGSEPGPICYRKSSGVLTITDANLLLGRISVKHFPKIFGPNEDQSLDVDGTESAFAELASEINQQMKTKYTTDEVAYGFIQVANQTMAQRILAVTQSKGHEVEKHTLACFGGAGAQHAVALARSLGIRQVFVHRHAPILSAYGLSLSAVVNEEHAPCQDFLTRDSLEKVSHTIKTLTDANTKYFTARGFEKPIVQIFLNLRFEGTDTTLMILEHTRSVEQFERDFKLAHERQFGFKLDRRIIMDDVRVRGSSQDAEVAAIVTGDQLEDELGNMKRVPAPVPESTQSMYFPTIGRIRAPLFMLDTLKPGHVMKGPGLVLDRNTTIVLLPDCTATLTQSTVVIDVAGDASANKLSAEKVDPIQLSLFGHRFMHIAEQAGYTLQKTSVSTNIKERLDFSCALFSPRGQLIANAPHIPVHLGSMQEAVKYQIEHGPEIREGDVLVVNHPMAGGSHLPDITVISPVFHKQQIAFFVGSRGHHADIGGISPGSMPPHSKELWEEGAVTSGFKIVENGKFQEEGITEILMAPGKRPGCSGTRNLSDNISDLKAQIAANHRGICLCNELIRDYGLDVVHAYMQFILENAGRAVKDLLKRCANEHGSKLQAEDFMDDGSRIKLEITIDKETGEAVFDFEGTSPEVYGNINAPRSVTYSAVIYCLRAMVDIDMPLNQGCLAPVKINIPAGSLLCPSEHAAVVGGNVMTSQRIVDVILRAFNACAASQGDCNNLTFGEPPDDKGMGGWGYYETIAGGAGAGPGWHGRSGVQVHMTNTRAADVEVIERRYPVVLRQFKLREGSGGAGEYHGGDGVIREIEFTVPLQVSILSERRVHHPYGMQGGQPGERGMNLLVKKDKRIVNLGGRNSLRVQVGDAIQICTPGGGGWGRRS